MSNFNCDKCGAPCLDSPNGYTTGCEHYPPDLKPNTPANTPAIAPVPKIKPLVWIGEGSSLVFATTAIGDFKCQFFKHASQWSVASNNWAAFHTCWFDSLEEAKAACEQEYERCVMECLE